MISCHGRPRSITFIAAFAAALACSFSGIQAAQDGYSLPETGEELYAHACAACHGASGAGAPASQLGFDVPMPDFTDCNFATREADSDWVYVSVEGGPARGFSRLMPAFGDVLSRPQIKEILAHIRTFCSNGDWARGELNLPRPLVTTKAYPEDELVLSTEVTVEGPNRIFNELIYEQRIGARSQVELIFPFGWSEQKNADDGSTEWSSSVGDMGLGFKHVLYHGLDTGSILSLGAEIFLPTGDEDQGFGSGTTVLEPYLAYGQILPGGFFAQFQAGIALPYDNDNVGEEIFWRGMLGRMFNLGRYGRRLCPMVEILGSEALVSGADTNWEAVPQVQITLNRRQHVRLAAGAQIPLNNTDGRKTAYIAYLLWDWFDGGLFEGW
ncbi:MAG: c-type cytochrome [Desulfosarcina sp.]